ncbi:universal stress protein [Chelativorans sp. Marseille-P2723]|uniref:universal stress protein n=1 Tax=Chelativorans sp. Marseille-P2723 TaxID=2709133 RepID=UPI00156FFD6F|nr:universal stress protein [Chelativorans sp. Marseille-P2723]
MFKHILICTDGSELADKGVEHGLVLASRLDAKVTVLSVTEPLGPRAVSAAKQAGIEDPVLRYDQQVDREMQDRFATITQRAASHGVKLELAHEVDDFPAETIVRFAELKGCDLIVMSSHGRRGISRVLLGSQTAEVVTHTEIPVLVVR